MDMNGISSMYNDLYTSPTSQTKAEGRLDADYSKATDDELMEACQEFEAYFMEQMMKAMWKTIPESQEMSGSSSSMLDYYKDEMIQKMAEDSTSQNSMGLAQTLYEQMKRNYGME